MPLNALSSMFLGGRFPWYEGSEDFNPYRSLIPDDRPDRMEWSNVNLGDTDGSVPERSVQLNPTCFRRGRKHHDPSVGFQSGRYCRMDAVGHETFRGSRRTSSIIAKQNTRLPVWFQSATPAPASPLRPAAATFPICPRESRPPIGCHCRAECPPKLSNPSTRFVPPRSSRHAPPPETRASLIDWGKQGCRHGDRITHRLILAASPLDANPLPAPR